MKYAAEDGKIFDSAKACREYEKTLKTKPSEVDVLVDALMKIEDHEFKAAMEGKNLEIGKILENAGRLARNARYAAGAFKSRPKGKVSEAPADVGPVEAAPPAPPPPAPLPQAAE